MTATNAEPREWVNNPPGEFSSEDLIALGDEMRCFHCGLECPGVPGAMDGKRFCCVGCETVYRLLEGSGLEGFYRLETHPGVRVESPGSPERYGFLNDPDVRRRFADYSDERKTRATFYLPAIHCAACVWLLENLVRLHPGIERSRVNFSRKEVCVEFENAAASLSDVAGLLAKLGYEPELRLSDLEAPAGALQNKRMWLKVGVAGFAFGNIMLFSFPGYLGLNALNGPGFQALFGWASLVLALPVVFFSAGDYWRSALTAIRTGRLNIDVPIAIGMSALLGQSLYEVFAGVGGGYLDSLTGLIFFLLCGRVFQQKTYDRLNFDRDYRSFFPLSAARVTGEKEESISISRVRVGDRLLVRNNELIPADSRLRSESALIDYSFVTGESLPVRKREGDWLYAGGRQKGGAVEVETVKPVSQSYLTSLWNQEAFARDSTATFSGLSDRLGQAFTFAVIAIATATGLVWLAIEPATAPLAFTAVLIVACPCALALSAPFAFGAAIRQLGRADIYVKAASVIERLARADTIVFDKTGTLTEPGEGDCLFEGPSLTNEEAAGIAAVARESTHPLAMRLAAELGDRSQTEKAVDFQETPGKGVEGLIQGREVALGSRSWMKSRGIDFGDAEPSALGSEICVAFNGVPRGVFRIQNRLRPGALELIPALARERAVHLLSGDTDRERARFGGLFREGERLHFEQSPVDKLAFIRRLQREGGNVIMAGDGLNDAGALKQSDVGISVVERIGAFSPASDIIMSGAAVARLGAALGFVRNSVRIVKLSFGLSILYNIVGVSVAAQGLLSPAFCAILMPASSITVVAFAVGATALAARAAGLKPGGAG